MVAQILLPRFRHWLVVAHRCQRLPKPAVSRFATWSRLTKRAGVKVTYSARAVRTSQWESPFARFVGTLHAASFWTSNDALAESRRHAREMNYGTAASSAFFTGQWRLRAADTCRFAEPYLIPCRLR